MKTIKKIKIAALILIIAFAGFAVISNKLKAQTSYAELRGWAWSSNVGWISFNSKDDTTTSATYSVKISTSTNASGDIMGNFSGYAWSSNVGWISFNSSDLNGCPEGPCPATVNLTTGQVTGWMRVVSGIGRDDGWKGWIRLSGTNHLSPNGGGVSYDPATKKFTGYAWGGYETSPVVVVSSTTTDFPNQSQLRNRYCSITTPNSVQKSVFTITNTSNQPAIFTLASSTGAGVSPGTFTVAASSTTNITMGYAELNQTYSACSSDSNRGAPVPGGSAFYFVSQGGVQTDYVIFKMLQNTGSL